MQLISRRFDAHALLSRVMCARPKVDMYCELLNEQISAERYRTAGAGCGRGDNTPYIRDTALLSFRHSFALNVQVKTRAHSRCFVFMVLDLSVSALPQASLFTCFFLFFV